MDERIPSISTKNSSGGRLTRTVLTTKNTALVFLQIFGAACIIQKTPPTDPGNASEGPDLKLLSTCARSRAPC